MVPVPDDFSLAQAVCSYGYYLVPPNLWVPDKNVRASGTFSRPLRFGEGLKYTAQCTILQAPSQAKGSIALKVDVAAERQLTESDQDDIRSQVVRMFQTTADLTAWFKLNKEAEERHFGRLFRSPTLFEDMVKSVTACNIKFGGTIRMNKLLCENFGRNQAFPTPEDLKGVQAEDLKERAKVGYRGDRILRLAEGFRDGSIDPAWLGAPERTRGEVLDFVKKLHGFGDFAASNVAMHLKFYDIVPMDSETVRHFKDVHGITTKNVKEVAPRVRQQYEPYAPYQFLQYWWEMIRWHEVKRGKDVFMWQTHDFANLS